MFRTQQNAYDEVVAKATDENLTSENWEYILDVCDRVQGSDTGAKDVVAAMIKRLAHRNANVQLYTLELANALSQNCGLPLHRELASRSFTDALLRLAGDRTSHQQVKSKILEHMEGWSKMFKSNPELGIMEQAYHKLKTQNPNLEPPQAPQKQRITDFDRRKEEEEIQMALKLSIQENKVAPKTGPVELHGQSVPAQATTTVPQSLPSGTTAATVSRVRALYDFVPSEPGELQFRKGDIIAVLESVYKDWWKGSLRGQTGIFPLNYVEKLTDPTQEELREEARVEAEVFGQIKNVERLLALLSTNAGDLNVRDNEEITSLYQNTLAIRPKLIELIGKYTQKKDDFQQLNEKFIKARRDYEALLETSLTQVAQPYPARPGSQFGFHPGSQPPAQQHHHPQQRFYGQDSQSSYGSAPPQQPYPSQQQQPYAQQPPTQGFQPPYPSATPMPQSQTPTPYPASLHATGRRQSLHSDVPPQTAPGQYAAAPSQPGQPQEMGTSIHDVGPSQRQPTYPPPTQGQDLKDSYSPSVYSNDSVPPPDHTNYPPTQSHIQAPPQQSNSAPYPPQQSQLPQPQPQTAYPSQPPYQAPPAPSQAPPSVPVEQGNSYPGYPGQGQTGQVAYQAYQPPPAQAAGAAGGGGGPAGYYR